MSDELSFGNGKKLSREDFRREIKDGSLSKDARFKKILSAFDVNGNGQADDGEIDDLFGRMVSYAGRDGNSVFDRREIEAFLEDTQVEGKSLQSMGMSANELMGFFKAEPTSGARETYTYNSETGELSEDEIKEETISFIDEEFKSGMAMLEGYDAGIISKGYAGIKEFLKSKLSKSNVARALYVKQETSELLRKAKRGDLTKKEYYGDIQQLMYDIFPEIERLDKDRQNQIRERIVTLSPAEIQKEIDKIVQLPNRESPEYKNSIRDYLEGFSEITSDTTIVRQEGDRSGYFDKRIKSAYKLSGNEDLMTFEEVFQDRYGVEYKSENLDKLTTAKNELSIMYSMKATYDEIYKTLHAEILDCEAMQEPCAVGMSEIVKQGKAYSLKTKIFGVLDKLGLTDDESKAAFIKKATGIEVSIENGEFVQGENEYGLYKSGSIEQVTYIAKRLLSYVEKQVPTAEEFEKKQNEVYTSYRDMFGENDTDGLVQSYINDNESAVGKLRGGVEGALGLAMVVSLFVCPPAALGFGIAGSVAGIGLEAVNEISRKNSSKEKFKELGIELAQNAALFASGIGAGKAGMSVRAMLVAQKCPKLMSVIADVGVDVTLSAISNLIIIGDLQLEQESVAQIVALLAGHIRAGRFKSGGGTKPAPETVQPHHKPTVPVDRLVDSNKTFFNDFLKTGKAYELAQGSDGTYILRFKQDAFGVSNKYTYCILDKDKNLVKMFDGITPNEAKNLIPEYRTLDFKKHAQRPAQANFSIDFGILETLLHKITSQIKCKNLMAKVGENHQQLDELLSFYGVKNEDLQILDEVKLNKLVENLEIFEAAMKDLPDEQRVALGKLFSNNPDITKDLANLSAIEITKKIGVEKLSFGGKFLENLKNDRGNLKEEDIGDDLGVTQKKRDEILAEYKDTIEACSDGSPEFENMLNKFADYINWQKSIWNDNTINIEGILWNLYMNIGEKSYAGDIYSCISNLLSNKVSANNIDLFVDMLCKGEISEDAIKNLSKLDSVLPKYVNKTDFDKNTTKIMAYTPSSQMLINQLEVFAKLKPEYQQFCIQYPEFWQQYSVFGIILPDVDMRLLMKNFLDMRKLPDHVLSAINLYKSSEGLEKMIKSSTLSDYLGTQSLSEPHTVYRGSGFSYVNSVKIGDESLGELLRNCKSQEDFDNLVKKLLTREPIHQPDFMSTSLDPKIADSFAKNIKWELTLPKGTQAACIDMCSDSLTYEAEVLVQRNSKLLISHIERLPDGRYLIKATVVQ